METPNEKLIAALEGKPLTDTSEQAALNIRALEGNSTSEDITRYARAQGDLAIEAYANALARYLPHRTRESALQVARERFDDHMTKFRRFHKTEKELLESATRFIESRADETDRQLAAEKHRKNSQPMTRRIN